MWKDVVQPDRPQVTV